MTTKYLQPGNIMTRSNPGGSDVDSVVKVGRLWGVTLNGSTTEPTGTNQQIAVEGVFNLPKLAEGIAQGTSVYSSGGSMTATPTGSFPVGIAFETMTTGATEGAVKLNVGTPTGGTPTGLF